MLHAHLVPLHDRLGLVPYIGILTSPWRRVEVKGCAGGGGLRGFCCCLWGELCCAAAPGLANKPARTLILNQESKKKSLEESAAP
eukprot:scaffold13326_cov127-Isochrysis_galbana.AAC.6